MKVEFIHSATAGVEMIIPYAEFMKADKNDEEFDSFAFATDCFFTKYGNNGLFIDREDYEEVKKNLAKGEAVIITVYPTGNYKENATRVYVTNNFQRRIVNVKEHVWRSY